ncbi:MAG TPA: phospho-N-acetylmuramoyl-pentapeptide-transferase [Candidatus Omnitrophota bacterium]|nr:phospho-N-acetylmuramoyl-pentapeptide-transferase [Candidatus Omnitrophota bacterium]HPS20023.1 phospho-N-acetylmuramoyl-pentapeptide-transferase [Candidatus Omnitrophota bacterium]
MFYHLLYPLKEFWFGFNIFKYISFRAGMAALTAFLICMVFGPAIIDALRRLKIGQVVRKEHVEKLTEFHNKKEGTPTMGGLMVIISVLISSILWCRLDNDFVILVLGGMIWLGLVGFADDYIKLVTKNAKGVKGETKIFGQVLLALIVGIFVIKNKYIGADLYLPFMKDAVVNLGLFYVIFVLLVIVGSSNAVNLTDGLDGLAIGCVLFVASTFAIMTYVTGHAVISKYLQIFYLPGSGELTCLCGALVGASMGFLWFNSYPANVFMGDTGSLSIGGTLAIISVLIKKEFLLVIVGGIFVVESLSVILQVISYKTTKKRIFLMSPIHHHFQIKGWAESKITVRFWIISAILAIIGLASLKVR